MDSLFFFLTKRLKEGNHIQERSPWAGWLLTPHLGFPHEVPGDEGHHEQAAPPDTAEVCSEGDIRTARTAWCTARAPRLGFYQPFPAFFTFFQGGKDAVA